MSTALARAHIEGQRWLREIVAGHVGNVWAELPGYDEENVDQWLEQVVPFMLAAQAQSVSLTEAFLARALRRQPLGIDRVAVMGANVRGGAEPEQVYRRPFVTVWSALQAGTDWERAVNAGLERATSTAATDVQLSMRGTLVEVGGADDGIYGYERVPDGGACSLCLIASTQRYHSGDLMPIHNRCGCGVEVITDPDVGQVINRARYDELKASGEVQKITRQRQARRAAKREHDEAGVAVHGELGPVLVDPTQHFTGPDLIAA